jgi:hypothetical protein
MTFMQQAPAETTSYMIAGYTVIFGVMLAYVVSLIVRSRRTAQELASLEEMEESSSSSPQVS